MRASALAFLLALAACASSPEAPVPPVAAPKPQGTSPMPPADRQVALKNPGFEDDPPPAYRCAPRWGCTMHASPDSFRFLVDETRPASGKRSFRIEPAAHKEPWALVMQVLPDITALRGARVRYSLAVRTEGVEGKGGGPMVIAQWPHGSDMNNWRAQETGTTGWKRMQVEFVVPKEAGLLEVGAIFEGTGKLWIDDARFEILERPAAK